MKKKKAVKKLKKKKSKVEDNGPVPGADELEKLLAFDPKTIKTREEFFQEFEKISRALMNDYTLEINDKSHRLTELEYYFCGDKHMDIFTHQDRLQETSGNWYFHKTGNGYKGGSYKGLDITFGQHGFGGILIRAIQVVDDKTYIEGPCMSVNHILELDSAAEVVDYVSKKDFNLSVSKKSKLYLRKNENLKKLDLVAGPRFGLTLKKTDGERSYYIMKSYRFMCQPGNVKKGRVNLVLGLHGIGKSENEIKDISGCTPTAIKKYISLFEEGKQLKYEEFEGKTLSNDDLCKLYGLLMSTVLK